MNIKKDNHTIVRISACRTVGCLSCFLLMLAAIQATGSLMASDTNRVVNGSMELRDLQTGEPQGWALICKDPAGKGALKSENADEGKYALCLEAATAPQQMVGWIQRGMAPRLADCPPGTDMLLSLRANTRGVPDTTFQFYIEMTKDGKNIGTFMSAPETIYLGWDTKILRFTMPETAPDNAYLVIRLLAAGQLWIDNVRLMKAEGVAVPKISADLAAEDFCRAANLPPRHTYFAPHQPDRINLEFHLPAPVLRVTLSEIDGKEIKRYQLEHLPINAPGKAEISLPELPEGSYELFYESGAGTREIAESDLFRIRHPQTKGVAFTSDHRMTLDGKPFFPIAALTPTRLTADAIRVYSQSGINAVNIAGFASDLPLTRYMYEQTSKYKLAVFNWNNLGVYSGLSGDELRDRIVKANRNAAEFPNFIGWLDDEAAWNSWPLSSIQRNYRLYFKYAPDYISWQNHAPRLTGKSGSLRDAPETIRRYSRQSDVTGLDIYPVPAGSRHNNLPNRSLSCVGDYTDLVMASAWGRKPVWMVLQAFAWPGGRLPTSEELRFMIYNAITHGASGIAWYGQGDDAKDIYSQWWSVMADVNRELNAVASIWVTGTELDMPSIHKDVRIRARTANDQTVVIAVNEASEPRSFDLQLHGKFFRSPDGAPVESNTHTLPPWGAAILSSIPIRIEPTPVFKKEIDDVSPKAYGFEYQSVLLDAEWVAHPEYLRGNYKTVFGRQVFTLEALPKEAVLRIAADDQWKATLNGRLLGKGAGHRMVYQLDVMSLLKPGENVLIMELTNVIGPTGVVYELQAGTRRIASGADTEFSEDGATQWTKAHTFGKPPVAPWGAPTVLMNKVSPGGQTQ